MSKDMQFASTLNKNQFYAFFPKPVIIPAAVLESVSGER